MISYTYDNRSNLTSVTTEVIVSVDEGEDQRTSFTVRPNPASDHFVVEIPTMGQQRVTVEMFTPNGELVLRRDVADGGSGVAQLDVNPAAEGLSSGTYQVAITIGDQRLSGSVVITR